MIVKTFTDLDKNKATKKMLDYWYNNFRDDCVLVKFFNMCSWIKSEDTYLVTYRGPEPKDK
jgi:hypothetical protein